ncbi:ATP-binding cassette subfamily C protein CydC [Mesocricetibacter intestinalis]|uniref:Glutathione/L-cysteine transport system ATP-binding/permease protein CydC n=1 Tax=Mesocricetibacter intestinalis TaxID=1521930 RepID=A0A4R6VBF4_9PAST|nr:cysteine/glutathione ABC transporter ATP-binding protein/permease CydC [Mesocricetibacter intestinalis]TDQ57398.1 ATP-binding cassette subfamily C protein CydC [Mesocricetibacter intestinalis]
MRSLLPYLKLFNHARFPLIFGIVLMIAGLASSIGLLTLSGWFLAATAIAGIGSLFNFFYPSASVRGLAIGRTVARYFEKIVTHDATFRILAKLRVRIFSKIIPLSPAVLNRYRNADLLNRLVADVDTLDTLYLRLIAPFFSALTVIACIGIGLAFIHLPLALFISLSLLLLLMVIPTVFYRLGTAFGDRLTRSRSDYRTGFIEFIQSQAELVLFNAEDKLKSRLQQTEKEWQSYQRQEANLSGLSSAILLFANGLMLALTLWFAADAELGSGEYKAAFIALFTFAALSAFEILMPIGAAFLHIGQIVASAQRLNELEQQAPLVKFDGNLTALSQNREHTRNSPVLIQLQGVTFCYPGHTAAAVKELNLEINKGEKIAVLGKTGSGKSSILQLLVRNYDPNQGEILLAGQPLCAYSEAFLRSQIGLLSQRVHIFSDTLRNNLQIAAQAPIQEQTMYQVLEQTGLSHLIADEGLDLWLGDGGRPLSGGERRRLGLARILLNSSPILLLDEPTEGLDRETEYKMLKLIFAHCRDKTLVMITHRLSQIEQFDRIMIIDEAKLIEQGSYEHLRAKPQGVFKALTERI